MTITSQNKISKPAKLSAVHMALVVLFLLLAFVKADAFRPHPTPRIPSPIDTTYDSDGNHRWLHASDFKLAGGVTYTADASAPGGGYISKPSTLAYNEGMAAACDPSLPNQTNYVWFNVDAPSIASNAIWFDTAKIPYTPNNPKAFFSNNNVATTAWTWTQAHNGARFNPRTNEAALRTLATNGSGCVWLKFEPGVKISYVFLSDDSSTDPAAVVGAGSGITPDIVLLDVSGTPSESDLCNNANALPAFTGNGAYAGSYTARLAWDKDTSPRKVWYCFDSVDAVITPFTGSNDGGSIYSFDYWHMVFGPDLTRSYGTNTVSVAVSPDVTPKYRDGNYPSGAFNVSYNTNVSQARSLPAGKWRLYGSFELPTAITAGSNVLCNFEMGDNDAGVFLYKFWRGTGSAASDPEVMGICQMSGDALPGGADTTPPTIGTPTYSLVTSTSFTATCTVDEAGTYLFEYGTTTKTYTVQMPSQNTASAVVVNITGLSPSTTYFGRCRGSDSAGNSASGSEASQATGGASNTYYLATNGSDSNPGTSAQPWKTWTKAISELDPGEVLIVKNGTYGSGNGNGYPKWDCAAGLGKNGTALQPITVRAENERQAAIITQSASDNEETFQIWNCNHIRVEGFRIENGDFNRSFNNSGGVFVCRNCRNVTIRRNIIRKPNRYNSNSMAVQVSSGGNNIIEENEIYEWWRHGLIFIFSDDNIARRNYANNRGYGIGPCPLPCTRGHSFISYPANRNRFINNIQEGPSEGGFGVIAKNSIGNKFYGNVTRAASKGFEIIPSDPFEAGYAIDTEVRNNAIIAPILRGMDLQSTTNTTLDRLGIFNAGAACGTDPVGVRHAQAAVGPDGNFTMTLINSLIMNSCGVAVKIAALDSYTINYNRLYANTAGNFNPIDATHTNTTTAQPVGHGSAACYLWQANGSGLSGAGLNSAHMGPRLLYVLDDNGNETATKLWNTATNKFAFQGAIISGVNSDPATSLDGIASRLRIGAANGCAFPVDYAPEDILYAGWTAQGLADGSSDAHRAQISNLWSLVAANKRVIRLAAGTYTGAASMIVPPTTLHGTAGARIIVECATDGGCLVDGQGNHVPVDLDGNDFFLIQGINAANSSASVVRVKNAANDLILRRVVAWNAKDGAGANEQCIFVWSSSRVLLEDVATLGKCRNGIQFYGAGSDGNICRRCWARWEGYIGLTGPELAMQMAYDNSVRNVLWENPIGTWKDERDDGTRGCCPGVINIEGQANGLGVGQRIRGGIVYMKAGADSRNLFDSGMYAAGGAGVNTTEQSNISINHLVVYIDPSVDAAARGLILRNCSPHTCSNSSISNATLIAPGVNTIGNQWTQSNVTSYTTVGAAPSIYDGAKAQICKRYVDGTLTGENLWPWPMDSRIAAALATAGSSALAGGTVTTEIESIFGTIPAGCRT